MKLYKVKQIEINEEQLVNSLLKVVKKYRKANICLYVNWIAKELGIPKVAFTSFLLDNPETFVLSIGEKSQQMIIKEIVREKPESSPLVNTKEGEKDE